MSDFSERPSRAGRGEMTEALAARILEHINGEPLAAGSHLAAQELADRFNVSRSPVNRALRLLHEKGVLAHEQNRGYFVRAPSGATVSTGPQP
jgi:DNA-binding GntR family transcriptional regulator